MSDTLPRVLQTIKTVLPGDGKLVEVDAVEYAGVLYRIVVVPQDAKGRNEEGFGWTTYNILAYVRKGTPNSSAQLIGHPDTDELRLQWEEFPSSAPVRAFSASRRLRWAKLERLS